METLMSSSASTAAWNAGASERRCGPFSRRGWEIVAIILGFIFAWPVALAYVVWKIAGYPLPNEWRSYAERHFGWTFPSRNGAPRFRSSYNTGNLAFEEYRRSELERLEEERRRLDEESRAFAEFVEELKRAKDREEFDAFMAKRRSGGPTTA
jgi:uncharacterized protein DUF2852